MCVPPHLSLVQPLYGGVGAVGPAGLHRVVGADAQHGAGVPAGAVGHHQHPGPLGPGEAVQVLLGELSRGRRAGGGLR